jgi:hypothetical protein
MSMVDRGLPLCVGREAELERLGEARAGFEQLAAGDEVAWRVERSSQAS